MDRNSVIGLILIAGILIGYSLFNQPSQEEIEAAQRAADSLANLEQKITVEEQPETPTISATDTTLALSDTAAIIVDENVVIDSTYLDSIRNAQMLQQKNALVGKYGGFVNAIEGEDTYYTVETDKIIAKIASRGGRIVEVRLKEYDSYQAFALGEKDPVMLFDEDSSSFGFEFKYGREYLATDTLYFVPEGITPGGVIDVTGGKTKDIALRMDAGDGKYIEYLYSFKGDQYDVGLTLNVVGLQNMLRDNAGQFDMEWVIRAPSKEKSIDTERRTSELQFKYFNEDRDYLSAMSSDKVNLEANLHWVAFKQHFFSAVLISNEQDGFSKERSELRADVITSDIYLKEYGAKLTVSMPETTNASHKMQFFFGPNHFSTLKSYDIGMERIIDLGWGIFGWVNRFVVIPIFNVLDGTGMGYGLIILLLTLIIKIILLPLMYKNYKSSAKMRVLKPEIEAITEKHKNDEPMKKQQATMALYKKTGVNPMAGCLPMLIQMPILYAMFRFFPSSIELRQQGFFWADDLSSYDSIVDLGFTIPIYGDHISLFTLLMAISTMLYTRLNSASMPTNNSMPMMKTMMYLFPIMMLFFFNNFSAALSYYYFAANLTSIGQMYLIKRYFIDEDKIRLQIQTNKKKPQKKSRFQQKLEDMQKAQKQKARRR